MSATWSASRPRSSLNRLVGESFAAVVIWAPPTGSLNYVPFTDLKQARKVASRATSPCAVIELG